MSPVPDAIDALVSTLIRELRPAQVIDGPATTGVVGDAVWVGITPEDPTTDSPETIAGLGKARSSFEVRCLARSWSGSADVATQRRKSYALIDRVKAALLADRALGGAVMLARFGGDLYTPYITGSQLVVDVTFRVAITAYS